MKQEAIEKAAFKYGCEHQVAPATGGELEKGFLNGAHWRINSVWHDASEKPKNQLVLFECRKTYGKGYSVNFGENYEILKNVVLRWAYIDDLLPERKEEAK